MDWIQLSIFIISVFGLFVWNRAEARSDMRHTDTKLQSQQNLISEIQEEIKDFHGRLCKTEERYLQLMQRIWESKNER